MDSNYSSKTTSVRKIDNGFIIREEICEGDAYKCTERYSKVAPAHGPRDITGSTSLANAVRTAKAGR